MLKTLMYIVRRFFKDQTAFLFVSCLLTFLKLKSGNGTLFFLHTTFEGWLWLIPVCCPVSESAVILELE